MIGSKKIKYYESLKKQQTNQTTWQIYDFTKKSLFHFMVVFSLYSTQLFFVFFITLQHVTVVLRGQNYFADKLTSTLIVKGCRGKKAKEKIKNEKLKLKKTKKRNTFEHS